MAQNNKKDELNSQHRLEKLFNSKRDLTIIGNTTKSNQRSLNNKKTFIPNLVKKRNTNGLKNNEGEDPNTTKLDHMDPSQQRRVLNSFKKNISMGSKANSSIQTIGIFSSGIALMKQNLKKESNNYLNDASDNQGLQKPKIVKKELKIHKLEENEEQLLSNLIRDNGTEDEKYNTSVEDKEFPISIKDKLQSNQKKYDDSLKKDIHFTTIQKKFMIIQLPDTLPSKTRSDIDNEIDSDPKKAINESSNIKLPVSVCTLNEIDEGCVGKIIRYRSGKTKLLIGDAIYDIEQGLTSDFEQSVFAVNKCVEERSANFYNFGSIRNKLTISPDWNWLFTKL